MRETKQELKPFETLKSIEQPDPKSVRILIRSFIVLCCAGLPYFLALVLFGDNYIQISDLGWAVQAGTFIVLSVIFLSILIPKLAGGKAASVGFILASCLFLSHGIFMFGVNLLPGVEGTMKARVVDFGTRGSVWFEFNEPQKGRYILGYGGVLNRIRKSSLSLNMCVNVQGRRNSLGFVAEAIYQSNECK